MKGTEKKEDEILVSICCITYNHEEYIRDALEGFINQKTNFKYEILVHDDASTDNTVRIIKEYEKKYPNLFRNIYQKENQYQKGNSPSRIIKNTARGKYIALCEGDDYWIDENKLQMQVDYMENHKDCTFCFSDCKVLDQTKKYIYEKSFLEYYCDKRYIRKDGNYDLGQIVLLQFIPTATFIYRRSWEMPKWWTSDLPAGDIIIKLSNTAQGYAHCINRSMAVYRINTGKSVTDKWKKEYNDKDIEKIQQRLEGFIKIYTIINKETEYKYNKNIKKVVNKLIFSYISLKPRKIKYLNKKEKEALKERTKTEKIKYILKAYLPKEYTILKQIKRSITNGK